MGRTMPRMTLERQTGVAIKTRLHFNYVSSGVRTFGSATSSPHAFYLVPCHPLLFLCLSKAAAVRRGNSRFYYRQAFEDLKDVGRFSIVREHCRQRDLKITQWRTTQPIPAATRYAVPGLGNPPLPISQRSFTCVRIALLHFEPYSVARHRQTGGGGNTNGAVSVGENMNGVDAT